MVTSDIHYFHVTAMQLKDYHLLCSFLQCYMKDLVYVFMTNLLIQYCIATGIKTDKGQPQKLCISVAFTQVSKLGLYYSEMLPSLA